MNKLLEVRNLSVSFGRVKALDDINFFVEENDYLAIVGPNGSGKSSLMKCILGLIESFDGSYVYWDDLKREDIGYLPQRAPNQDKHFPATVYEIIQTGITNKKIDRKKMHQAILDLSKKLGIEELLNQKIGTLHAMLNGKEIVSCSVTSNEKIGRITYKWYVNKIFQDYFH